MLLDHSAVIVRKPDDPNLIPTIAISNAGACAACTMYNHQAVVLAELSRPSSIRSCDMAIPLKVKMLSKV